MIQDTNKKESLKVISVSLTSNGWKINITTHEKYIETEKTYRVPSEVGGGDRVYRKDICPLNTPLSSTIIRQGNVFLYYRYGFCKTGEEQLIEDMKSSIIKEYQGYHSDFSKITEIINQEVSFGITILNPK